MKKRALLAIFVIVLLVGVTSLRATGYSYGVLERSSKKPCGGVSGQVVTINSLEGISKELLVKEILRRAEEKPYLKKPLTYLNVSTVLALSSLRRVDGKLIKRDVVVIPVDDTFALVYLKDSTMNPPILSRMILSKDVILNEELIVFEIDPSSRTVHVKTRVQPLDGWSPVCSDITCTSNSDCPDRSSEGLYFPSCSDSCKDCTDWDYYCVAVYALNAGVCVSSCTSCVFGSAWGCAGCLSCFLMTPYVPDVYESCCKGEIVKKCEYYEWWD